MSIKKYFLHFFILIQIIPLYVLAQNKRVISGKVMDAANNEALPFATVSLKKQLIGIITNETGNFDLYVPEDGIDDTLLITYFGYKSQLIELKTIRSPLDIRLKQSLINLNEVVVRPHPPEFYIKLAILRIKQNYPKDAFQTQAYYREKLLENKNLIRCNEGIFKTYCPNYLDTVKNQNQLLLFRQAENTHEIAFMSEERKKEEEKEKRKAEKKKKKDKTTQDTTGKKENNAGVTMASAFGGPENILREGNFNRHHDNYLDTTEFKNYKYSFAKSSSYDARELMVIDFESKGKVEHVRESGRIYIDVASYAIVKIENSGAVVIPVIIRPILFLYGLGIENPTYEKTIEFQQVNGRWYPKNIQNNIDIKLSNNHWFKPDEHSDFEIEGIYTVNKMALDNISEIPVTKRFDGKKDMKTQVYNDDNITWEGINIIKK